jgi:hypothetical protein
MRSLSILFGSKIGSMLKDFVKVPHVGKLLAYSQRLDMDGNL